MTTRGGLPLSRTYFADLRAARRFDLPTVYQNDARTEPRKAAGDVRKPDCLKSFTRARTETLPDAPLRPMTEHKDTDEDAPPQGEPTPTRELLLLRAGGQTFAVYAEDAEGVAEGVKPAPLPHAPRAVLGVVCVRGRMYTLLDPRALPGAQADNIDAHACDDVHEEAREEARKEARDGARERGRGLVVAFVVALGGDEQLALAADSIERAVSVPAGTLEVPDPLAPALRATLERGGARILVLDPSRLFDAAMQGTERRRQRL
jgi:chemotaxis signal transduction protein